MKKINIPHHVAVIPDGNRRWSKKNNVTLQKGYSEGVKKIETIMQAAFKNGVTYFTAWAASEDNLKKRSKTEITILTFLIEKALERLLQSEIIIKNEIKIKIIGNGIRLLKNEKIKKIASKLEEKTKLFNKHNFSILFGYDGKSEMIQAVENMQKKPNEKSTYENIKKQLLTKDLPPVNLVIRTGGEPHWSSGFMMWHTTDSEFYFTETLWPAFDEKELIKAFKDYSERRSLKGK